MQSSDIPTKFVVPFANSADAGHKTDPIPQTTTAAGRASLEQGFPPTTFVPVAGGGNPPWGADANGILSQISAWSRWVQAGGGVPQWDSSFKTAIGGYPKYAVVQANPTGNGRFWISTQDNNTDNPDSLTSANWLAFPDLPIQLQKPNYAAATGAVNAMKVTLFPVPTSWAQIVGAPIRVKINHTNTTTTPTLQINGLTAAVCINADGSAIRVGQLPVGSVMEGIPRDDNFFQVNSPAPPPPSAVIPGTIYIWPNETVPSWGLECNGATVLIATYPNLFAVIGTRYGGNGTTNFKLPDFRGYFLRSWDHGANRDAGPRTANPGGISGDHVGSLEAMAAGPIDITNALIEEPNVDHDTFPAYNHERMFVLVDVPPNGMNGDQQVVVSDPTASGLNIALAGGVDRIRGDLTGNSGAETRPINVNVMYVIAF